MVTDRAEARKRRRRAARRLALRLALIYAVVATTWIVLSDRALAWLGLPDDVELALSSVKGFLFVPHGVTPDDAGAALLPQSGGVAGALHALFENAVEGITVFRAIRDRDGEPQTSSWQT